MSYTEQNYLDFKKNILDVHSPTMCAAKWMDATIWLYSGLTASCHHPPNHAISQEEIAINPAALHNTQIKKNVRLQMQKGERPSECEYCWKIEDLSSTSISDRVYHSLGSSYADVEKFKNQDYKTNYNPKRLELAFDRTCQFACAYCNPSYSSSWVKDIQTNGPYVNLKTDRSAHYESTHANSDPFFGQQSNPYIEAFWKWWPELKGSLRRLRITGGEPLLSPHFWNLIDRIKADGVGHIRMAVNTNLGSSETVVNKLIEATHFFEAFEIYTSCEAFGQSAEYIRDGLNFDLWKKNFLNLKKNGRLQRMTIMMTINGLCLFSITDFLDLMMTWKKEFGARFPVISLNIVRWPTFHSPLVLPQHLKDKVVVKLKKWLVENEINPLLNSYEKGHCLRLIQYLEAHQEATAGAASREELEKDLKRFMIQYDQRRQKNFRSVFDEDVVKWIDSIEE